MRKEFFFIVVLSLFVIGCEKDNQNDGFPAPPKGLYHVKVSNIAGPPTTPINQLLILEVTYPTSSGCDYISEFQTVLSNYNVSVKAFGATLNGTPCTQAAVPKTINFTYVPNTRGTYVFKFINPDKSVIVYNLTVI